VSATTLVWPRSRHASAYDLELVRIGVVIYSTRSSSPRVVVPRSWDRAGASYVIQPEDQVFVWPIVDGRRVATPAVDGILALDMTRIASLIEQSQSGARP
jgi:hypothetical protein